jgi:small subunit ribosomal protein S1
MSERLWEEPPDEMYWQKLLGGNAAPPAVSGWTRAENSYARGEMLELQVVGYNRGGLLVDLGDVRGFVPASQIVSFPRQLPEEQRMEELARRVGDTMRLKVIEFDRARNRLILSERVANPSVSHADQVLATIEPQQTRKGVVRNVTEFGAFVDLGGVEGLIHVSELSWRYVRHPRDIISPGQEVQVYIMEVNREQRRVACSLKRLTANPWTTIADKLRAGDFVEGVVTSVMPFGVFVRVNEGIEGLVHVSEMGDVNSQNARAGLQEGQAIKVRVIEIDTTQQRLRLSLRLDGSPAKSDRESKRSGNYIPPPPPEDPGYWDSLAQSGL